MFVVLTKLVLSWQSNICIVLKQNAFKYINHWPCLWTHQSPALFLNMPITSLVFEHTSHQPCLWAHHSPALFLNTPVTSLALNTPVTSLVFEHTNHQPCFWTHQSPALSLNTPITSLVFKHTNHQPCLWTHQSPALFLKTPIICIMFVFKYTQIKLIFPTTDQDLLQKRGNVVFSVVWMKRTATLLWWHWERKESATVNWKNWMRDEKMCGPLFLVCVHCGNSVNLFFLQQLILMLNSFIQNVAQNLTSVALMLRLVHVYSSWLLDQ